MKKIAIFERFQNERLNEKYLMVSDQSKWDECNDFLVPIDVNLNPLVDMKYFSPTAFGSLHLAFKLEKGKKVPLDFVGSLLNSPSAGRFQRLHFYVQQRRLNDSVVNKLIEAIAVGSEEIKGRPWCENLLPFIEVKDHPDIIQSNSEMIFVQDRFPKGSVHYLCLPRKRIDTWWHLKPEDIPLLLRMQKEVESFAKKLDPKSEFVFGFHVIPSMKQLHLHVVNKDFNSPILTYPQWNAFNSDFLITVPQVIAELEDKGLVDMPQSRWDECWALLSLPLRCSICGRGFRQLAALKKHYLKEYTESRKQL